jgi:hypothetical protein
VCYFFLWWWNGRCAIFCLKVSYINICPKKLIKKLVKEQFKLHNPSMATSSCTIHHYPIFWVTSRIIEKKKYNIATISRELKQSNTSSCPTAQVPIHCVFTSLLWLGADAPGATLSSKPSVSPSHVPSDRTQLLSHAPVVPVLVARPDARRTVLRPSASQLTSYPRFQGLLLQLSHWGECYLPVLIFCFDYSVIRLLHFVIVQHSNRLEWKDIMLRKMLQRFGTNESRIE